MQNFNFEKYLTAETGNPTQKKAIVNAEFQILRNT